jgi:hypothetical protein
MKVKAKALGFYGGSRRRPGEVFEVPEGARAKWFEPVSAAPAEPEAKPRKPGKGKAQEAAEPEPLVEQENADGLV